jgi:hypothetical protein
MTPINPFKVERGLEVSAVSRIASDLAAALTPFESTNKPKLNIRLKMMRKIQREPE